MMIHDDSFPSALVSEQRQLYLYRHMSIGSVHFRPVLVGKWYVRLYVKKNTTAKCCSEQEKCTSVVHPGPSPNYIVASAEGLVQRRVSAPRVPRRLEEVLRSGRLPSCPLRPLSPRSPGSICCLGSHSQISFLP